jgi:hypothetical protein
MISIHVSPILIIVVTALVLVYLFKPSMHAKHKHGEIVDVIRRRCSSEKQVHYYQDKMETGKFYVTCQLPDGRTGLHILQDKGSYWQERTAFRPVQGIEYIRGEVVEISRLPSKRVSHQVPMAANRNSNNLD